MFEWDYTAYNRKFSESKCLTQIEDLPPVWRNIYKISENGKVYEKGNSTPIGGVV